MKMQWPVIRWQQTRKRWMVDSRTKDGGQRRFFATKVEAESWADLQRVRRQNEGFAAFDDAELRKHGWTIADAIRFSVKHLRTQKASVAIEEAVRELIETKLAAGRSVPYCDSLRSKLARLVGHLGNRNIGQISTGDLESFLTGLKVSPATRNTYRRDCRTLWSFAEKRGWVSMNAAARTERAKAIDKPPGILTPEEAAALLAESHDPDLRAFHAIGLFAGLRVAEINKLDWRNVDLGRGFVEVSAATSKTRARRLVPIQENLRAWLTPVARPAGSVVGENLRERHLEARKRAGIAPWPENGVRHSFVSYRLASTGNAAQTALESGHDQKILFAHYRELVRPADAARYWEIKPADKTDNVVAFAAVGA
jgi:integrase